MILRRVLAIVPIVLLASFGVFCLETFLPGDAAATLAGPNASPERIAEIRKDLELDKPFLTRYGEWLKNGVKGDFGDSLFTRQSVREEIASRWLVTFWLVVGALVVALLVGVPIGILAGTRRGGWLDRLATIGSTLGIAVPNFVIGILLIVVFSIWMKVLPTNGYVSPSAGLWEWARHLILPVIALSGILIAELARQIRSALADVLQSDYIRTVRAGGIRERTVVLKHALRMATSPAIAVLSVQVARMIGGAVVVETVFRLPGLGTLTTEAILNRDLPVLQGIVPLAALVAVVASLLADILHMVLDPRARARTA